MADVTKEIKVTPMCYKHRYLLVHQAGYSEKDPWQALEIVSQIALLQAATADEKTHKRISGDVTELHKLGCLACYKPDAFGEIVEAAKLRDLGKIKALGEKYVADSARGLRIGKPE